MSKVCAPPPTQIAARPPFLISLSPEPQPRPQLLPRCVEGLLRACRALDGCLLALPVHPNWESYSTVPSSVPAASEPLRPGVTPGARFVTTRAFVRAVGGALERRRVCRVNIIGWSLGACFATMLREEFPALELGHVVFVDPAAALPLASSAWAWLLEPRFSLTLREFRRRSHRCGLGAWLLRCGGGGGGGLSSRLAAVLDFAGAAAMAASCRTDHLRVAPELHPCAHGCDFEGELLDRQVR